MSRYVDQNCRVVATRLTTTSATTVLDASGYTQVIGLRLANFSGAAVTVSATYVNVENGASYYLLGNYSLQPAQSLWLPLEAFALNNGDLIRVQASAANAVDVIVSIAETPGRSG